MSFFGNIADYLSDLRDRAAALYEDVSDAWSKFRESGESESGEEEIFDEDDAGEVSDIIADGDFSIDDAIAEVENEIAEIENEIADVEQELSDAGADETGEIDRDNWPDWLSDGEIESIIDETGVSRWDEVFESERDEFVPGWRGIEDADEPASEIDDFREEMQRELGLSDDVMDTLSEDELMTLATLTDNSGIGLAREFEEMSPEEVAEALEGENRGAFEDWEAFLDSELWQFVMDRPDLFEIYVNEDGEIEVYEIYVR